MINNYSRNRLYTDFPMDSYNIFCPERTHYPILAINFLLFMGVLALSELRQRFFIYFGRNYEVY